MRRSVWRPPHGLAACAKEDSGSNSSSSGGGSKAISLGFSQVGSESGWRTANTDSVKEAAKEAGYTLKFSDAQQKQENQISAIRSFIAQKVDVIAFSPVVVTGWDAVLKEAKAKNIPVVLTDRSVETSDDSLYVTLVGSDFTDEGRRAAKILEKVLEKAGHKGAVKIAQLEGTTGAAPAIERAKGFKEVMEAEHKDDWKIVVSQTGDFTRAGGKQVMAAFLQSNPDINVLFAHNDDMAIGAIQSIEAAGEETRQGHPDRLDRRREGRLRGHVRWQDQRHCRVQPAARSPADGHREEGQGRRDGRALDQDRGERLHAGPGQGRPPKPQVLTDRTHRQGAPGRPSHRSRGSLRT